MNELRLSHALLIAAATATLAGGCTDDATLSTGANNAGGTAGTESTTGHTGGGGAGGTAGTGGVGAMSSAGDTGGTGGVPGPVCGDGDLDPDEACDDGNQNAFDGCLPDCTVVAPIDTPAFVWTYIEVPGTRCLNGETAGFGVSLSPDSKNVMIYLEGGGACFNELCDFTAFSIPFVPPPDGIFNRANLVNPVNDWNMIYVPYCSGDIHGGDNETELGGKLRYFHGYRNIAKYLEQWVPTFPEAENVLLTGISAGGFGAGLNAGQVTDAFGVGPQMIVIDDSGPPLSKDVIAPCLQATFREVWGLDQTILAACGADCPDPNDFASGYLAHVMKTYPDTRFGVFSNTADVVIRGFMGFGWGDGNYDQCDGTATIVPADDYEGGLLAMRAQYVDRSGTYYVGQFHPAYNFGKNHTVLRSSSFWTTVIDGTPVSSWVGGVIDGDIQHVGP